MTEFVERSCFSYEAFGNLVRRFARDVPQLLQRHPSTVDLAFRIEQLALADALQTRFTVAVIGQMRVGKSTLLNALIGRDLAPTGVTETTATINWFRHGTGELCDKFRVHWNDGSTEDLALDHALAWLGARENATRTRRLDFFSDSDFLKTANIVDTPGTRSVLDSHTDATEGFLAEKLEAETLKHGGRADAVIYVINPVARTDDEDMLKLFGERTRLPGASAYNSIAVVQKWEHLDPDPLREVERKCDRLRQQLQGKVADVIPTSGLLAQLVRQAPPHVWAEISRLATASDTETLDYLLRGPNYFGAERAGCALDRDARVALNRDINWTLLRFLVRLAQARKLDDGPALRQAAVNASGLARLKQVLQEHFFSLAGLIQASTVLRKADDHCIVAMLRLAGLAQARQADRQSGRQAMAIIDRLAARDTELESVGRYLRSSLDAVEADWQTVSTLRTELDSIRDQAINSFHLLDSDIACLRLLDHLPAHALTGEERSELYRLFGGNGLNAALRLGLPTSMSPDEVIDYLWSRHEYWAKRRSHVSGDVLQLFEHALNRIATLLDHLDVEAAHD